MPITIEYREGAVPVAGSPESNAAHEIVNHLQKKVIDRFPDASGHIYVISSYRFHGQARRDIDILMIANVDGLYIRGNFDTKNGDQHYRVETIDVRTFMCNIELKSHERITYDTGAYRVRYGNSEENVTEQANQTRYSLVNYIKRLTGVNIYIWDAIWFQSLDRETLDNIRNGNTDNAIAGGFDFNDLLQAILTQANVRYEDPQKTAELSSLKRKYIPTIVNHICHVGYAKELDIRKFNHVSIFQAELIYNGVSHDHKLTVLNCRAGAGKTLQLLSIALSLTRDKNVRCVMICPYNTIVADVYHLMDYLNTPFEDGHGRLEIMSFRKFFMEMMQLQDNEDDRELYESSLLSYDGNQWGNESVKWDYILIDEAQNMTDIEKSVLLKYYAAAKIVVACSQDSFMWSIKPVDWTLEPISTKILTSNTSIRQKVNLVRFAKSFAGELGLLWPIEGNPNLAGGKVKIYRRYNTNIHSELVSNVVNSGGMHCDILYLMPTDQSIQDTTTGHRLFSKAETWAHYGIDIFDGMDKSTLSSCPPPHKVRLFPYMYCAGLEAWCVVCYEFDKWAKEIIDSIHLTGTYSPTEVERLLAQMLLLPLTRPIDTLIFTLSDQDSQVGKILHRLADTNSDFIEWLIY